jgi:DNA-binding CsgD family transcriptional regulator
VLAVGGLPVDVRALQEVAGAVGVDADKVAAGLAEATDAGLVVVEPDGSVWFHHPLVAEVLGSTLLPPEATRLHAVYVAVWLAADSAPGRVRAAHLALHYEAAGDVSAALTWSLRAAVEAEVVRGYGEESNHLARACHLWPGADEIAQAEAGEYIGLLLRAIRAAHRAGDFDSALSLGKQAYTLTAERNDPLTRCRILHDLMWLHQHHLLDWPRAALQEAVELSSAHPTSPEYAQALADLSWFEQWHGLPDAKKHAAESLAVARASGSDEASAFALLVAANASSDQTDALLLAEEAMTLSRRSGDATLIAYSASVRANCLQTLGRARESGPYLADVYSELMRAGAPHEAGWLGASAANHLLTFGDSRRCRDLLRDALSIRMSAFGARLARLVAAALAARSGHPVTAQQHLDRAEEFAAPRGGGYDNAYIWCALDVLVAQRNYRGVLELAVREVAAVVPYDPDVADQLLAMAAMAVADLMVQDGAQRSLALDRLVEIETLRSAVEPAMFQPRTADDLIPPAYGALYAAHRSRTAGDRGGDPDAWRNAVDACDAAGLRWEAVGARYWEAAALLTQRLDRGAASAALREAFRIATDLGAEALCADIEALALQAHISLVDPEIDAHAAEGVPVLDGLTKREHEVLAHLVAGRTYAEIAQELFISEKTVSAHVSNLLRKTSTTSRIELAALARRHSTSPR